MYAARSVARFKTRQLRNISRTCYHAAIFRDRCLRRLKEGCARREMRHASVENR